MEGSLYLTMTNNEREFYSGFPTKVPYGANVDVDGVHFSIFSRHATRVWLLLFESADDDCPSREIELHPEQNLTGDIWHVWVRGLKPGQLYLWRMDGPWEPERGHQYDPQVLLLDPYAKALTGDFEWHESNPTSVRYASGGGARDMPKCIICSDRFEWEGDRPLNRPWSETVIYECHVRGFTAHETSNVEHPGTFAGVVEKIPYFKSLGVTALEFLPVQEFSIVHNERQNPLTAKRLLNYWGYNTVCFFAPNGRYSASGTNGQQVREFKQMVRELHRAGIEVILDVVFNHTGEGGEKGPTFSFKGIDNSIYYLLDPKEGAYLDYTGCGNTVNCNHPVVRDFVISCLHYWVLHMHVDGFRFDLASILGRDETGKLIANPPLIRRIEEDPILRCTKIIAEAWDAAGAYQVGAFTGRWAEWNGKFRDDVRRFWRGDPASVGPLATRLTGSSDLYGREGRTPHHSINFAFSHDGFTLNDWATYQDKHNLGNGQNNEDGDNNNLSINHGVEGPTQDLDIETLRERQMKNVFATLMLSLGVPMVSGGDEFRRTQQGNNNPYCQDNEISWFDWMFTQRYGGMLRFAKEMISFRRRHPSLRRQSFYTGKLDKGSSVPDIIWYGVEGKQPPDWNGDDLALAALIRGNCAKQDRDQEHDIFLMLNANIESRTFAIPLAPNGRPWKLAVNTQNSEPEDIYPPGTEPPLNGKHSFGLKGRSMAVMIAACGA